MKKFRFKTFYVEWGVVMIVLAGVNLLTKAKAMEWIGAAAVLLSFGHAAIADRMTEKQARMETPDVECYRWSVRYFAGKEVLWVVYFIMHHSYSALVGCGVFLIYPFWRALYRRWKPLGR